MGRLIWSSSEKEDLRFMSMPCWLGSHTPAVVMIAGSGVRENRRGQCTKICWSRSHGSILAVENSNTLEDLAMQFSYMLLWRPQHLPLDYPAHSTHLLMLQPGHFLDAHGQLNFKQQLKEVMIIAQEAGSLPCAESKIETFCQVGITKQFSSP